MFSSSLSFVLINYISVLCPSLPMKASFVFFPLLVLGLSTGIYNDTCWWKQGENTGENLFCSVSVMSLLALDLVACICLMKHGCFNLRDCPSLRSISSLLEIESWLSKVPVIIVIKTVPPTAKATAKSNLIIFYSYLYVLLFTWRVNPYLLQYIKHCFIGKW